MERTLDTAEKERRGCERSQGEPGGGSSERSSSGSAAASREYRPAARHPMELGLRTTSIAVIGSRRISGTAVVSVGGSPDGSRA